MILMLLLHSNQNNKNKKNNKMKKNKILDKQLIIKY